jgi:hypothetical protein
MLMRQTDIEEVQEMIAKKTRCKRWQPRKSTKLPAAKKAQRKKVKHKKRNNTS